MLPTPAAPPRGRPTLTPAPRRLGRRGGTPVAVSPEGLPTRRRWGRFAAGTTLALLGAWIFAALYVSAGQRVEVLALAHDVDQYHTLVKEDFRTVRVAADPGVRTVKAGKADEMLGRVTAVPLVEGTLLAKEQLIADDQDELLLSEGERRVPLRLKQGAIADEDLEAGMIVELSIRPTDQGAEAETINNCWIKGFSDADENTGERDVVVVVPVSDIDTVTSADNDHIRVIGTGKRKGL
jgi:hypothetical protein